jgi:PAS domain S-box-containing protein
LFDTDGGVRKPDGPGTDIYDSKITETTLRYSEERFRCMLETMPMAAYTCDAEGLVTSFNEYAVEVWGRTPQLNAHLERFCGSYRLYSPDGTLIPHDQCWMALAIKEGKAYEGREIVIERPDGSRLTVLAYAKPFYNEAGKLIGAVNIMLDITGSRQAEAAMAQIVGIVESSADAIIGKDLNGIITSWNKGAEKLFGYAAGEVIGKPITILFPPDRLEEESRIARDITERKRSEIEREELLLKKTAAHAEAEAARAEAEAANSSKDKFLAVVTHELRSPLNAILSYNKLLRENLPDAAHLKSSCDVIERNAKIQLQLIEDLLDTTRIISGKLRLELRPLDIIPLLADALDVVRHTAEAKGVQLRIAELGAKNEEGVARKEPAILLGDANRLQQIFWNLLSNAIKFTPAGGSVELRFERD